MAATRKTKQPYVWGGLDQAGRRHYRLHGGQSDVMRSKARFTAAIAGTGGGKTALGPLWLAKQIQRCQQSRDCEEEPILGMVVAPTYPILSRATVPTLVNMFAGTDLEGRLVESRNIYYLPCGLGKLYTLSADNPGSLEGGQFDFIWIDEGGQISLSAWIAIQGRLGLKRGPALITTTPYALNWLYHDFYKRFMAGDTDYFVRTWSSHHNPAYSKEEYDRAMRTMTKERAQMRYDGRFCRMAGLVYPDMPSCVVNPIAFDAIPDGRDVGGIDFGWNNPFAALLGRLYIDDDGKDVLYVYYERYKRTTPMERHVEALQTMTATLPPILEDPAHPIPRAPVWYADPSRPDSINELRAADITARPANNDLMVGIDAVCNRMYTGRLRISRECKALLAEAEEYHYPSKDEELVGEKPVAEFNHALDALRYMVMGVDARSVATRREAAHAA